MAKKYLTENFNRIWSSLIIDQLIQMKITNFYISPGMRNIPLIHALLNQKEKVTIKSGIDERAQGFRALGYSKASGKASVLICTSGSALSHYLPAIIEAYKTQTPLIILSADRPFDLTYSGANQTVEQKDIFNKYTKGFLHLECSQHKDQINPTYQILHHFFTKITKKNQGVLHLNLAFKEPLDSTKETVSDDILAELKNIAPLNSSSLLKEYILKKNDPLLENLKNKTGLIVIGERKTNINQSIYKEFISKVNNSSHFLYLDVTSSLKQLSSIEEGLIPSLDHPEVYKEMKNNPPDFVLHFGGKVTSKYYYQYLNESRDIPLYTINDYEDLQNPSLRQTIHYRCKVVDILKILMTNNNFFKKNHKSNELTLKESLKNLIQSKALIINNSKALTYPQFSKNFMELVGDGHCLFLGNSTTIRSFDNYVIDNKSLKKELFVYSNRGASGIEGNIATAIGIIDKTKSPLTLILGDISFLHDLNSLHLLRDQKIPLRIILCNNFGGGIFNLLPIAKDQDVLPYITTPHNLEFFHAAKLFGLKYSKVKNIDEFKSEIKNIIKDPTIIEVFIDDKENTKIYHQLKSIRI